MYEEHLKTCEYCQNQKGSQIQTQKPTIRIIAASSYRRKKKLSELAAVIKGVSYPGILYAGEKKAKTKVASSVDRSQKLKALAKIIKGW